MAIAQAREGAEAGSAEEGYSHREAPEAETEVALAGLAAGEAALQGSEEESCSRPEAHEAVEVMAMAQAREAAEAEEPG